MSELWAYVGASLLLLAAVPQTIEIARTRRADGITWGFAALNFAGILLLGLRSAEIGEPAFVLLNAVTATFWGGVLVVKAVTRPHPGPIASAGAARVRP